MSTASDTKFTNLVGPLVGSQKLLKTRLARCRDVTRTYHHGQVFNINAQPKRNLGGRLKQASARQSQAYRNAHRKTTAVYVRDQNLLATQKQIFEAVCQSRTIYKGSDFGTVSSRLAGSVEEDAMRRNGTLGAFYDAVKDSSVGL